jgi:hypothetical protein
MDPDAASNRNGTSWTTTYATFWRCLFDALERYLLESRRDGRR